jgi:hypothetical protein
MIALSVAVLGAANAPTQAPEWRLTRPLSEVEKANVLALAARLNLGQLAVIRSELILQPLGCEAVRLESVAEANGNRRTWRRAWITNTAWSSGCPSESRDSPRIGQWVVADHARDVGAWHVQDAGIVIDVETPSSIPYADVAAIISAVREERLVNRLPAEYRGDNRRIPKVDAKSIFMIWNDQHNAALYKVNSRTTNVVLLVAVRGGQVELRGWMTEMA